MTDNQSIVRRKGRTRPTASERLELFATVPLGGEELTAAELVKVGADDISVVRGGVSFCGNTASLYRALLQLRTASRLLLQLTRFPCSSPEELYDGIYQIDWSEHLNSRMTLAVDCSLRDSAITHSGFAALKAKDAVVDQLRKKNGSRPNVDTKTPDLRINLHIAKNICTVSLDAAGEPLDRRGWRLNRNDAPLRETLAAAIMQHTGWDGATPLIDPMCGSGTLLLEGVSMALKRPAGAGRRFGIMKWHSFDNRLWQEILKEEQSKGEDTLSVPVLGFDRDPQAIITCRENARRAGLAWQIAFDRQEFDDLQPNGHQGLLVMNPPFGVRMGDKAGLEKVYSRIGEVLKRRFTGWTAYILAADMGLARHIGLKPARRFVLFNGPLECRLLKYELY